VERKTWRPTSCIPVKRSPDRFRNAFRIRFRLALPFGTDHTCSCGFSLRDENVSHPLRCNAHGSNYACHNATLAFVKSLARDAGYHAQKGDFCVRESSPSADGVRAEGFNALADEHPSKDLIIDVFGSDPSNISFIRASSNILFEKAFEVGYKKKDATYRGLVNGNNATVLSLGFTIFGSFCPNLRSLFNRFTQTIYDNEKDSFCRSLSSIRKYYTNLWSVTCLSMSATALTKARSISSKSYNAYDAQCNYMQDVL
jgi:hypothetical protein